MYRIIYITLAVLLTFNLNAQEKLTYKEVDQLTYRLYVDKDWRELIREGKEAIREGIDYYYLRMRIGIACYELNKYQSAIPHFEKALAENPDNPAAQEYMYYAYLFSGRKMDAMWTARNFSDDLLQKTGINRETLVHALSPSFTWSGYDSDAAIAAAQLADTVAGDGFQSIPKNFTLFGFSLSHRLGNRVMLTHSAELLNKSNFIYGRSEGSEYTISDQTIRQLQYYLSPAIRIGKGFTVMPAFHLISYRIPGLVTSNGMGGRTTVASSSRYNDYVASLTVNKAFPFFNAGLSFAFGTLNNANQYQTGAELTVYPFGNLNLYSTVRAYALKEYYEDVQINDRLVLQNTTGFKVLSWLWFEAEGSWGDHANFSEYNGAVVYNSLDVINNRYAARFITWLRQGQLQFVISYSRKDYTNNYFPATFTEEAINTIQYSSNTISGGMIWKL